jgi:hypothetical protein
MGSFTTIPRWSRIFLAYWPLVAVEPVENFFDQLLVTRHVPGLENGVPFIFFGRAE